jgi:hypothetical protein
VLSHAACLGISAAMPSVSPSQALTEEQRQQIIAKLLAERRSKSNCSLPEEGPVQHDRAARVQELIRQRAAAKQQHAQQGELDSH